METVLQTLSQDLADAVQKAGHGVVRIEGRRRMPASGISWREAGVIVTANHVVQRDDNIQVGLPDGETVEASLVGRDPAADLAVLKIPGLVENLAWKDAAPARVGHLVLALGRPGEQVMATHGIISGIPGDLKVRSGSPFLHLLQTDVVMYPGFSGGALVDSAGKIIGMNTSGLMRGISAALDTDGIESRVRSILEHGFIPRGYLGVTLQPVRLSAAARKTADQETALLIAAVEEGSPAEVAGLYQGDIAVSLDGVELRVPEDLMAGLQAERIGSKIILDVLRGGQVVHVEIKVGERK